MVTYSTVSSVTLLIVIHRLVNVVQVPTAGA
jgi:hypothetical protein